MCTKYPRATLDLAFKSTVNGRIESGFGLDWPQGFLIACGGVSLTKKGIASALEDYNIATAIVARLLGIIECLLFFISLPIMLAVYTILLVWAVLNWILLGLFMIPAPAGPFKAYMIFLGLWIVCYFPTLLTIIGLSICSVLQILVPELTIFVFKSHEW